MSRAELEGLLRAWQRRLGLQHWRIAFNVSSGEPSDNGDIVMMSIERHDHYNDAVFHAHPYIVGEADKPDCVENFIAEQFGEHEMFERKVIHELLHLWLRDITVVGFDFTASLGRDGSDAFEAAWGHAEESTVDALATTLFKNWGSAV